MLVKLNSYFWYLFLLQEIVVGSNMDKIYIVMNYVEHDLKSLMETMKQPFLPGKMLPLMEVVFCLSDILVTF